MKRVQWFPGVLIILLCVAAPSYAQNWTGIISPSRAVNWSNAGVTGGIPFRNTICTTLNPGATATQINSAISSCPSGQVVFLNAGTYNIAGSINFNAKNSVTLRGAGPDQTKLIFTAGSGCNGLGADVCVINADNNYSGDPHNVASWTGNYAQGSTSITFGSVTTGSISNLHVGSQIILDQNNDASDPGMAIYVCGTAAPCSLQGSVGNGIPNRQQEQMVTVTSISGSGPWTIGITPGVYAPNYVSSKAPGAWWSSALPVTGVGIESMSLDHDSTSIVGAGIMFVNAMNGWVKNVRSINNGQVHKHVWLYQSSHITVRDSYLYGSNGTSESYGVDSGFGGSDNLVENIICQRVATCTIGEGTAGTVFAYYYATDNYYIASPSWQQEDAYHHSSGDHFILWEGNIGSGLTGDVIHGPSFMLTAFRNRFSGRDGTKTLQTNAVHLYSHNRFWNVVGNVLGTVGYHTQYQVVAQSSSDSGSSTETSVFNLNYSGNDGTNDSSIPNDLNVSASLLRWGNYDTVNAGNRFVSSEVPSGISIYANPVPSSQSLPASFYLSSKPAWWGSTPWPGIGPDVTGGTGPGGRSYDNPASACYKSSPVDSSYGTSNNVLLFNGDNCYSSVRPMPPTNISILVQ